MADANANNPAPAAAPEGENDALTVGKGTVITLTKMSVKTLGCKAAKSGTNADNRRIHQARIRGVATGIKKAVGNDGTDVYGLTGSFEGWNIATGQRAISGVCYLPSGIQEMILEPLDRALLQTGADPSIMFAYDIYSQPAANKSGYEYSAVSLIAAAAANPFAALDDAMKEAEIPTLPAPAPAKK